ncbi:MAG: tRNA (adenosine(37)-N6)-dimethylallyltransferase MiaA [Ruminococcaceae bacterium]|nr:tRNA (adenosine(37)-N6)-dimethylallyltransferase MiaA [Oscillospiraceae bacterium]
MNKPKVIFVVGPTASGKTGLAITLARRFNGEIVSADSMQIYKGISIASAAPTEEEKQLAVHHLVEFLEPEIKFSVADYVVLARKVIEDIISRGKLPIIVGGTGLYIDALIEGIEFTDEKTSSEVRENIEKEYDDIGGVEMLRKLSEIDALTAEKLSPNDKKRIVRAFEVYYTSGITITEQNERSKINGKPYDETVIGISCYDREKLYERINKRVDLMVQSGIVEEAKSMRDKGYTSAQAIGHKEFYDYLDGKVSLEEAIEKLKRETRRYAKRQLTWFRRNENINWVYSDIQNAEVAATELLERMN